MKMDRRLAEYILTRIASGEYQVGTRIPSFRRLASKFRMPYSTVQLQMGTLVKSGILKTRAGKGVYVAQADIFPKRSNSRRIAAFIDPAVIGESTSICYIALLEFQQHALAAGLSMEMIPVHYSSLTEELYLEKSRDCCGAALFKEYDSKLFSFESPVPVVATLMSSSYGGRISLINVDEFQVAELAVSYFLKYDLEKVDVIGSMPPVYHRRAAAFRELWQQSGRKSEVYYTGQLPKTLGSEIGYFFTSDTMLNRYFQAYYNQTGRFLHEDFVILGVDGKRRFNPDWPLFPTVAIDWREIGACMFTELMRRINSPQSIGRRVSLGGRLMLVSEQQEQPAGDDFAAGRSDCYDGEDFFDGKDIFDFKTILDFTQ